jgi:bifunctional non-homologous end joining protein LigD
MDTRFTADDKLVLTNLSKVFWPERGYTKGDLITYYREIALVILPYLADRPQVLHRHVDGHSGKEFFQRVSRQRPSWLQLVRLSIDGGRRERDFHLCQDWPSLLWMANFGCIEFGPWASRVGSLDQPDYLVIDLDPGDVPFARVIEAAIVVRKILEKAGAASCCKTSGKRGLHVYVPLGQKYSFPQVKLAADILARLIHRQLPATTTLDSRPEKRQGRIYLDTTRNARGQAVAVAYCARPHPGATVSAPLKWSEVRPGPSTPATSDQDHAEADRPIRGPVAVRVG